MTGDWFCIRVRGWPLISMSTSAPTRLSADSMTLRVLVFFQNVRLKAKALCVSEKAQRRVIAALFQGGATHSDRARASFYLRFERIDGLNFGESMEGVHQPK